MCLIHRDDQILLGIICPCCWAHCAHMPKRSLPSMASGARVPPLGVLSTRLRGGHSALFTFFVNPPNLPCVVPHHHLPPLQPLKSYLALAFRGDSGHASVPSRSPRPGSLTRLCLRGERQWTSAGVRAVVGSQISYRARKEGSGTNCDRGGLSVSR